MIPLATSTAALLSAVVVHAGYVTFGDEFLDSVFIKSFMGRQQPYSTIIVNGYSATPVIGVYVLCSMARENPRDRLQLHPAVS